MIIGISLETTRVLRDTWHAAINHEWYEFLRAHTIVPLVPYGRLPAVEDFDCVVLAGGNDMPDIQTWRNNNDPVRDRFERELIEQCVKHRIPTVGICRGSHYINYVMGGTHVLMDVPYDNVEVDLHGLQVICHHTIRIDSLAPGFEVVKQDTSGVIELAVNKLTRQLLVGWHPERRVNEHTRPFILDLIKDL